MEEGIRFPDDMVGKSTGLHDDDKVLISDSQDAKKAKWWSLSVIKTWLYTFFARLDASNVVDASLTAWQTQLEIAILRDEIDDLTGGDAFSVTTNSINATSSGTTNLPITNKIGILKVFHYGSLQYLTYNTWNNDAMEYWSNYYNGSTWGAWINLTATVSPQNWVDMVPQGTPAPHSEGRFYYDSTRKSFVAYNDESEVALNIGSEIWGRLDNTNAYSLLNGKVGYVRGSSSNVLDCDLMDASKIDNSIRAVGLFTHDIETGTFGYVTRLGVVRDFDTTAWEEGDVLWADPDNLGEMVNVRPSAPNYPVRIGMVLIKHLTLGAVVVDTVPFTGTDTTVNIEGMLNGIITQTAQVDFSVSGGIIYATVSNENYPANDLPFLLHDTRYHLDTTTAALQIAVPPGADAETMQKSLLYIYLDTGVPTLAIATSEPSIAYAPIGDIIVFNAVRTLADGQPAGYRRSNNAIDLINGVNDGGLGFLADLIAAFREKLGSNWNTGQDATETINDTTIKVAMSAGLGRQFRKNILPAFDGNKYLIYNDASNQITYEDSINLTDIVSDAAGNSLLGNGRYYTIRLFYQLNSNGVGNTVIATRPLGYYTSATEAQSDGLNYAVAVGDTNIEELIWPLYDIIIGRTGASGVTISLVELRNRRSKLATGGAGGGGAQGTSTDDKVRVSANDTTNDYLTAKLVSINGIVKTIVNPAGNEQIQFGLNTDYVKPSASDSWYMAGANTGDGYTGNNNIVAGAGAMESTGTATGNTVYGWRAGRILTNGNSNVIIGASAADVMTIGGNNTIIGTDAGKSLITASANIFIGLGAGTWETNGDRLYISSLNAAQTVDLATSRTKSLIYGFNSSTTASQTLAFNAQVSMPYTLSVLGDTAIGGATGSEKLHVYGNVRTDNGSYYCNLEPSGLSASNNDANYQKCITAAGYWIWRVNGSSSNAMILSVTGQLGIGISPSAKLVVHDEDVNANVFRVTGPSGTQSGNNTAFIGGGGSSTAYNLLYIGYGGGYTTVALRVTGGGEVHIPQVYSDTVGGTNRDLFIDNTGKLGYVSSSKKYKKNIKDLEFNENYWKLRPVTFDFKDKNRGLNQDGLIAEAVETQGFDKLCSYNDKGKLETIQYSKLGVYNLAANLQLKDKIIKLEKRVLILESR